MPFHRSWWVRGPVLGLVVAYTSLMAPNPRDWIDWPIPVRLAVGLALALLTWGFWALVVWGVRLAIGRRRRFIVVLTCFPVLGLLFLSGWGTVTQRRQADPDGPGIFASQSGAHQAGRDRADGANDEMASRRAQFSSFFAEWTNALPARKRAVDEFGAFAKNRNQLSTTAQGHLHAAMHQARTYQRRVAAIASNPDLEETLLLLASDAAALSSCIHGFARFDAAVKAGRVDGTKGMVARTEIRCHETDRYARQGARAGDRVFHRLGGPAAFPQIRAKVAQLISPG